MDSTTAYRGVRERMIELARDADATTPVPSCPGWTVHDLLAHVTGVVDDVVHGRLDGVGTEPWTDAQVDRRRGDLLEEVLEEWAALAEPLDAVLEQLGDGARQMVFDATTHEHDLRGALDAPGARDSDAVEVGLRWVAETWATAGDGTEGTLLLAAGDVMVTSGTGEPAATLELDPFDAVRALTGRRSLDQLRAAPWDGDPEPFLDRFAWGPFTPARSDVLE